MTSLETRRYAMLVRVNEFGIARREQFPESSVAGQAFAAVGAAVARLKVHAVSKMSTAREGSRAKTAARAVLLERLAAIERTARTIADDVPGFDDSFRLPRRLTDETLLTAGRVFAHDAEPARVQLVAHGLPPTFITELGALVDRFEQAVRSREAGTSARIAAQTGISAALLSALAAVRKLDVIMANQLRDDPVEQAVWERHRRVIYPTRRAVASPAPVPPAGEPPPVGSSSNAGTSTAADASGKPDAPDAAPRAAS